MIGAEVAVRDMILRNKYENRLSKDGGNPHYNPVNKTKTLDAASKGNGRGGGKGKRNGGGGGGGGYAAWDNNDRWQENQEWQPSEKDIKNQKWKDNKAGKPAAPAYAAQHGGEAAKPKGGGKGGATTPGGRSNSSNASTGTGGSNRGKDRNGNHVPCWLFQTKLNGGYTCPREDHVCDYSHKQCSWETLMNVRLPRWVCGRYANGEGRGSVAWKKLFKEDNDL